MSSPQKKVLIISGHEPDRETMRLLLGSMGCPWILASTLEEGAKILGREPVAAAILDSGLVGWDSEPRNVNLHAVVKFLPGRVILLLSETLDPRVVEFARGNSLPIIKRERWAQELWGSLEEVLRRTESAPRDTETASLVLDTFSQPPPTGIRYAQPNVRHLLYETRSLSVDVSFERVPDSKSILLAGQILISAGRQLPLQGAAVSLRGPQGALGLAVTNQWGEFVFEFERQPKVVIEIEDGPNHRIAIHSPDLSSPAEHAALKTIASSAGRNRSRKLANVS